MRAVILEVDERMLAERRRLGLDHQDEMWEGVLHMVPPPFSRHGQIQLELGAALLGVAKRLGLSAGVETGVFAGPEDYRVPDLVVYPASAGSERGIDGAPLVVFEIRSPNDESYDKVPWYLARGTGSVVIVEPATSTVSVFTAAGPVEADADGLVAIPGLGARLGPCPDGDGLVVETEDGVHRIGV